MQDCIHDVSIWFKSFRHVFSSMAAQKDVFIERPKGMEPGEVADAFEGFFKENGYETRTKSDYREVYRIDPLIITGKEKSRKIFAKRKSSRWMHRNVCARVDFDSCEDKIPFSVSGSFTNSSYGLISLTAGAMAAVGSLAGAEYGWMPYYFVFATGVMGGILRAMVGAELSGHDPIVKGIVKKFSCYLKDENSRKMRQYTK